MAEASTAMDVDSASVIEVDPSLVHEQPQNIATEPQMKEEPLLQLIESIIEPVVQPIVETNREVLVETIAAKEGVAENLELEKDLAVAAPEATTASTEAPSLE